VKVFLKLVSIWQATRHKNIVARFFQTWYTVYTEDLSSRKRLYIIMAVLYWLRNMHEEWFTSIRWLDKTMTFLTTKW